jgi:hypothetical protein
MGQSSGSYERVRSDYRANLPELDDHIDDVPSEAHDLVPAFYEGIKHKPETTFGNMKTDVLATKDPKFQARELLQCHPRFAVEELRKSLSERSLKPPLHSVQPINFAIRTSESEDS